MLLIFIFFLLHFNVNVIYIRNFFFFNNDLISISLILLTLWLTLIVLISQTSLKFIRSLINFFFFLLIRLVLTFLTSNIILFYIFFECSLIPIFLIILGWGYQPERLKARLLIFFYTLYARLPLLILVLKTTYRIKTRYFKLMVYQGSNNLFICRFSTVLFLLIAFLVKFPIYFFHLWLPKAHVEAPVSGSMVLAGVLLKLGGYGLIRISALFSITRVLKLIVGVSLMGSSLIRIVCLVQSDIKVMIAYSSVVHMGLVIVGFLTLFLRGLEGRIIIIVAHGFCSSALFAGANIIYERSHSRRFNLNTGYLTLIQEFTIFWFVVIMANFGGPFTINILGEIMLIINLTNISFNCIIIIMFLSFMSAVYCFIIFLTLQQGKRSFMALRIKKIKKNELQSMLSQLWPLSVILLRSFIA